MFWGADDAELTVKSIRIADQNSFPLEELENFSGLDRAQLEALHAALSKEIALIQAPPGTGFVWPLHIFPQISQACCPMFALAC